EPRDLSTTQIRAWQNSALVREPVTESSIKYQMVLIETKKETIEEYYGTQVAADGSVKIDPGKTGGRKSYVFDILDGDEIIRIYVPSGEVTEVGDQVYVNGDPIGYEITVTGYAQTVGDEVVAGLVRGTPLEGAAVAPDGVADPLRRGLGVAVERVARREG
ncbi:hypothetical protein IAE22_30855, partial [Bacillus sp. S34]|nr:hypothetical protein [Bacillus sp. S34]